METSRTETRTKKDVARFVADLMDEPIYKSEPWVSAVITALGELMIEADPEVRIELRDFGVFEVKKTKAKPRARNPQTNETVFIPSRRKTHFKPSKRLKEVLQTPLRDLDYKIPEGSADKHLEGVSLDEVGPGGASENHASENGVATNGAATNGAATNGAATNGAATNGAATNGAVTNGAVTNGAVTNGAVTNGAVTNGAAQ